MISALTGPSPVFYFMTVATFALLTAGWLADVRRFFNVRRAGAPDRLPGRLLAAGTTLLVATAAGFGADKGGGGIGAGDGRGFLWVWCAGAFVVLLVWRPRLHRRARPLFSLIWLAGLFLLGHVGLRTLSV